MSQHFVGSIIHDRKRAAQVERSAMIDKSPPEKWHREISNEGRQMSQYIQDLYQSGAKMWTKESLLHIETELAKQPRPYEIMIRSMNSVQRRQQVPLEGHHPNYTNMDYLYIELSFKSYSALIHNAEEECFAVDPDEEATLFPLKVNLENDRALATRAVSMKRTDKERLFIAPVRLRAAWDEAQRNWIESPVCSELKSIISGITHFPATTSKIVCFGLGSLEGPPPFETVSANCDDLPRRSAMTQHAAALSLAAWLGARFDRPPLAILVQDPLYSPEAKNLLTELGIEVVKGRGALAFTHVDEETLVFSCHPNIPVKQIVADLTTPAAMIWNSVTSKEDPEWKPDSDRGGGLYPIFSSEADTSRTRKLVESYSTFPFPAAEDRFGDLAIYVRNDERSENL